MFESTIPFGEPELMRASAYRLYLRELEAEAQRSGMSSRISSLSPSLRADLYRFEADGGASEVLEVIAACVRHAKKVTIQLQYGDRVAPLTVFPDERLVYCPLPIAQLLVKPTELCVMHVEPAMLQPPGHEVTGLVGEPGLHAPLAPLLWELALRGGRGELLPEIAGPAVYRIAPGLQLNGLPMSSTLLAAIYRLRRESTSLREISDWAGLDREKAVRLLNALYLLSGLMVSRSHPDAINDNWFNMRSR